MPKLHRAAAVVLRQFFLLRTSTARILPLFIWAAIDIVLWGFITRYLNELTPRLPSFIPLLLGAVLLWDFFSRVMHGVATAFLEDVWSRNFLNLFSTPLSVGEYVAGLVTTSIATSMVGLAVMLVLAGVAFGLSFSVYGLMFVPFLMVLFLFGIALGIFSISVVLRLGPASEWFVWPVPAFIAPFAAVFYPLSILPEWMQVIGRALPPAYVFEGMRSVISGGTVPANELVIGLALDVVYILIAFWFFAHIYKGAVRSGLLARYAAESVG